MKLFTIALLVAAFGLLIAQSSTEATFPGTNGKIAFTSDRDGGGNNEIYSMNPDGSGQTNLTNHAALDQDAVWSPDGSKIAFRSNRDGTWEIYVMLANGSCQKRLTPLSPTLNKIHPTWSPDGAKIAYQSFGPGNSDIYSMNATGFGAPTKLTNNPANDTEPDWSPDGSQIAFRSDRNGDWEIHLMDANGANQTSLKDSVNGDIEPSWSPDGLEIAYRGTLEGADVWKLTVGNVVDQQNLTGPNGFADVGPAWSPDGTKIAFHSNRDGGTGEIYIMDEDGLNETRVTFNSAFDGFPDWQPTGVPKITDPCIGGIAELPADGAPTSLASNDSSGVNAIVLAGVLAAVAFVALGGAAWYARSRRQVIS